MSWSMLLPWCVVNGILFVASSILWSENWRTMIVIWWESWCNSRTQKRHLKSALPESIKIDSFDRIWGARDSTRKIFRVNPNIFGRFIILQFGKHLLKAINHNRTSSLGYHFDMMYKPILFLLVVFLTTLVLADQPASSVVHKLTSLPMPLEQRVSPVCEGTTL